MRPHLLRLAALFAGLVLVDLAVGQLLIRDGAFGGRPLPPYGALTNPRQLTWLERDDSAQARIHDVGRFDAELGWTYRPGSQSEDGRESFNTLGARGQREYAPVPAPEVTRIVCVGDSFTYGEQIADHETFQVLLERRNSALEVLNFGVGGYGTDQALLRFRRVAPGLGGEVAVLGILLENIGRNVNRYRPLWHPNSGATGAKPRFILSDGALELVPLPFTERSQLLASVRDGSVLEALAEHEYWRGRPRLPTGSLSSIARIAGGYFAYRARDPRRLWMQPQGEPYRVTMAIIEAFQDEARDLGFARSLVLIFPQRSDVDRLLEGRESYWAGFAADLTARGIEALDLVEPIAERHAECEADPSQGTVWYGSHLSSVGNDVVARHVLSWLESG